MLILNSNHWDNAYKCYGFVKETFIALEVCMVKNVH